MAMEVNLIDIDFDVDDFKKEDDHPIVRQLDSFDQSDAKRNRLILVRLRHCLFTLASHN